MSRVARGVEPWPWLAVGLLVLAGLLLRARGLHQTIFGDELFAYREVTGRSLADVIEQVRVQSIEVSPPLYFLLARGAQAVGGDPTVWIRVPSLLLGALTCVPAYLLARRASPGPLAGLIAAGVLAVSPYCVFYGTEARPYATLGFLSILSTLVLLHAADRPSRRWPWVAYAIACALVVYTHYTGVFVLTAQTIWVLAARPAARRRVLLASAAGAVLFAPWLPSVSGKKSLFLYDTVPFTIREAARVLLRTAIGHPFVPLRLLPGALPLVLLAAATLASIVIVAPSLRGARLRAVLTGPVGLVATVALATPLGLAAYSIVGHNLFGPRNLMASVPAAAVLLGALVAAACRRLVSPATTSRAYPPPA